MYLKLYGSDSKVCGMFEECSQNVEYLLGIWTIFDRFVACIGWFWNLKEV